MKQLDRKSAQPVRPESFHSGSWRDFETLPDILTARELERLLRIDVKTIYSYVQRGLIPYVRIQSNVRFLKHQILDWIGDNSYRPR